MSSTLWIVLATGMGLLAASSASAQSSQGMPATSQHNFSARQIRHLAMSARSSQDFGVLAQYYRSQQHVYEERARQQEARYLETKEWILVPKCPTIAETSKWFAEDARRRAADCERLASEYERKSALKGQS